MSFSDYFKWLPALKNLRNECRNKQQEYVQLKKKCKEKYGERFGPGLNLWYKLELIKDELDMLLERKHTLTRRMDSLIGNTINTSHDQRCFLRESEN